MSVDIVIPTTRPLVQRVIWGLANQTVKPDRVMVISNEIEELDPMGLAVEVIEFGSDHYPIGGGDVVLRRNIGFWEATSDYIITLDDDQAVPASLVEDFLERLPEQRVVWGHHRYINFDDYPLMALLLLDPEEGASREAFVNDYHLWYSCYAGCMGIERSLILEVGGYDMAFLCRHGNEDQSLGRRINHHLDRGDRVLVSEPPFAWHPTRDEWHGHVVSNLCDGHVLQPVEIAGRRFERCPKCPYLRCVEDTDNLFGDDVIVPYEHNKVTLSIHQVGA